MDNIFRLLSFPKRTARQLRETAPWRRGHGNFLLSQVYHRNRNATFTDDDHLEATAAWLTQAQDVSGDGGVGGRYCLRTGWSSSYPETTGYIVPTFLALEQFFPGRGYKERASRCIEFLLAVQLSSGAFPGLEIAENRTEPSPFNTAQIIHGLVAWHRATGDERALTAAIRAGNWLVSVQDTDGAFRRYFYHDNPATYSAHLSCWLAELGKYFHETRFLDAAERHLDWVMGHFDATYAWFDNCGFMAEDHAQRRSVTHTLAYTLWGVLYSGQILGHTSAVDAVRHAAHRIARRLELSRTLPGVLDYRYRPAASYVCLTGNAQMALIWMRLHEASPDLPLVNSALKALDQIKQAQCMRTANPALRGAIAGSAPVWGDYIPNAMPNWAAKFFIDAMLQKRQLLASPLYPNDKRWKIPAEIPRALPALPESANANEPIQSIQPIRVVILAGTRSNKLDRLLNIRPELARHIAAVVVERPAVAPVLRRLRDRLRGDGVAPLLKRLIRQRPRSLTGSDAGTGETFVIPERIAQQLAIPCVEVKSLATPEGAAAVFRLEPDLLVHAGAGILRGDVFEAARLGIPNAHMGLLPKYRGMHVAEWAVLYNDPVGCSIHLIDPGIDTGRILCVREVDVCGIRSIAALRARVDEAQLQLLAEVLAYVVTAGALPPGIDQAAEDGVQFFRLHSDLRDKLDNFLATRTSQ